jgi:RNA polymerase sigma-70 factor (ECF subfamily)
MELGGLLERCRQGDELAWEALVREHQGRLYGLAYHYVGSGEEARDVVQEVFVRMWRNLDDCTEPQHFVPWTIRIARNACIDHLRRRKARPSGRSVPVEEAMHLAAQGPSPEDTYQADARKRLVHLALQQLSELSREIILLKDIQGLPFEEIGAMLDVPVGTLKSRSNRARLELARKVLALSGGELPEQTRLPRRTREEERS